jgi:transposase
MSGQSLQFWTQLLRLPDYEVVYCQEESDLHLYRLTVAPKQRLGYCPGCAKVSETVHCTRTRKRIKDLSIGAYAVELRVRVLQFECPRCGLNFTPAVAFLAEGAHATERFLERAAELARTTDLTNAAAFLGVPERTLGDWYYTYLQRRQQNSTDQKRKPLRRLGIDELSLKKKHRQYVAVIVDHDNQCVLEVLENRDKSTVLEYLQKGKHEGLLAQVEEVTTDMWDAYVEAAREAFGNKVAITIDRFHVMKNLQECLTGARRELQRQLSEQERQQLKGSRWLWVTNPENLLPAEQQELAALKKQFPILGQLADQREALRAIFDDRRINSPSTGRKRLQAWLEQVQGLGITALDKFCKTLSNWMDKIANYFRSRGSNGRTEGLNHGLRAILWRAFGMANFQNFRLRVLHCFGLSIN